MRVLIVEDEVKTAAFIRQGLTEHGYVVDVATDGLEATHLAVTTSYDLIVLDVVLPGCDGWDVLKAVRERGNTFVLLLSACDELSDRVRGLNAGADDYLVKPFAFAELLARVRTLLRRSPTVNVPRIRLADLEVDLLRRRVHRGGHRIHLTATEFNLLEVLVCHAGEVMSRTLITERVWDMHFNFDSNVVDVAVRRLRAKIDDPFTVKLIQTVRGVGYKIDPVPAS